MKQILFAISVASSVLVISGCKTTFVLTNEIKSITQNMTPEEAADKLSAIIEKGNTSASIGLDDIITGGSTKVTKDSITFYKTIEPQIVKSSSNNFANGYETTAAYTERRDVVITVQFNRVKAIKMHEEKNGDLSITIKDSHESFLTKTMYQFDTPGTNRELAIALCSVLIPNAKIDYSGGGDK